MIRKFHSPFTGRCFKRTVQMQLLGHTDRLRLGRANQPQYFVTATQAKNLCNTEVKPGVEGISIKAGTTHVYPVESLPLEAQKELLKRFPPYFGVGVGVLIDGMWSQVKNSTICATLNPQNQQRKLFVDATTAESYLDGGYFNSASVIEMADAELKTVLYHSSQCKHPHRVAPPRGLAINPAVGVRFPQPMHSKLVAAGLVKNFLSPMWATRPQLERFFRVKLRKDAVPVKAAQREGTAINVACLPGTIAEALKRHAPFPARAAEEGSMRLFDCGHWQRTMRSGILTEFLKFSQKKTAWVTLSELLRLQLVPNEKVAKRVVTEVTKRHKHAVVDLSAATTVEYFNGDDVVPQDRHLLHPRHKPFVIVDGEYVTAERTQQLLEVQKSHGWSAPVWYTAKEILRLGGSIVKGQKPVTLSSEQGESDEVFNIDDVRSPDAFLSAHPPLKDDEPQLFIARWLHIRGKSRKDLLANERRRRNLWVQRSELVISGLVLTPDAKPVMLPPKSAMGKVPVISGMKAEPRKVYNVEQCVDPQRMLAVSTLNTTDRTC